MTLTRGLPVLAGGLRLVGGPGLTADTDALVYLLDCGEGQAVLIDCGSDAARLLDNVAAAGFAPSAVVGILATHGHVDHVSAAADLIEAGCGGIWVHAAEAQAVLHGDPLATGAYLYGRTPRPAAVAHELTGDGLLRFGTRTVEVVATPGHSPGSVSYLVECAGTRIASSSSPLVSDVSNAPVTKTSAAIVRAPPAPRTTTSAPSADSADTQSAAGSALVRLPPMVPRLRTAR